MSDEQARPRAKVSQRLATVLVCLLAGLLIAASAAAARGNDLRPTRNIDLVGLVADQAARNKQQATQAAALRSEVATLTERNASAPPSATATTDPLVGLGAVKGPAVRVTLTDAPLNVQPVGVDPDMLVVHQQDIQQAANALWAGGAEAMTIQGQRVIATTGIKCVGNTVVLDGIPYAPPYVITAIGDQSRLEASLATNEAIRIYRQYVKAYQLGYTQQRVASVTMPGYQGSMGLQYATPGK